MSIENFKKTVWEARLLANYETTSIAEVITTPPTKIEGKTITFNKLGKATVKDYEGTVDWENASTTSVDVNMNQKKYTATKIDDVDAVQAAGDLVDDVMAGVASEINEVTDSYVLGLYTGAHADNIIDEVALNKDNVYGKIVDL